MISADEFQRRSDLFDAVRAGLHALVAVDASDRGDLRTVDAAVNAIPQAHSGWSALSLAEQAEVGACVAIGLRRGGADEAAAEWLKAAVGSAFTLARRGELAPFGRLCQALLELLPPGRAALTWAEWLIATASAGTNEALGLIAAYVRWTPADDLTDVVVNAQTGQLHSR
jgi:hypothetical protein